MLLIKNIRLKVEKLTLKYIRPFKILKYIKELAYYNSSTKRGLIEETLSRRYYINKNIKLRRKEEEISKSIRPINIGRTGRIY